MNPSQPSVKILQALSIAAEVCGGAELSEAAARFIAAKLAQHPEAEALKAIERMCCEHEGRFSLAAILNRIDRAPTMAEYT